MIPVQSEALSWYGMIASELLELLDTCLAPLQFFRSIPDREPSQPALSRSNTYRTLISSAPICLFRRCLAAAVCWVVCEIHEIRRVGVDIKNRFVHVVIAGHEGGRQRR